MAAHDELTAMTEAEWLLVGQIDIDLQSMVIEIMPAARRRHRRGESRDPTGCVGKVCQERNLR